MKMVVFFELYFFVYEENTAVKVLAQKSKERHVFCGKIVC